MYTKYVQIWNKIYSPYADSSWATIETFEKSQKDANNILKPLNFKWRIFDDESSSAETKPPILIFFYF